MPTYRTTLVRSFSILIDADSEGDAARLSEFFVGYNDSSSDVDRQTHRFKFQEIKMVENDVVKTARVVTEGVL